MKKLRKYERPAFLKNIITQIDYEEWLARKTVSHLTRDRKRGNINSTREQYKLAIHKAVVDSNGFDAYTGLSLRWDLIHSYDNTNAKSDGRRYKTKFSELPTVDHVGDGKGRPDFRICSWKVNDAKNDLSIKEFLKLCAIVLEFNKKEYGNFTQPTKA